MLRVLSISIIVLGVAIALFGPIHRAEAACQLIKATASAGSRADAAKSSQALTLQSASELKHAKRWTYVTLYAYRVKGDPFWKAVRPDGVPKDAQLKPDIITSRFYTTCFTGVVVPYVCTTGSAVCGN
jgi:hypothetical protein